MLNAEFQKNPFWGTEHIKNLANQIGFSRQKVYKWNYDRIQAAKKGKL